MNKVILSGLLLALPLAVSAGEPSSRVAMDPELLKKISQADAKKGNELAATCGACHDTRGAFPTLDGQLPTYLYKQLQDYKDGHRQNAIMSGLAATLSEEDMVNISAHYAQKKGDAKASGTLEKPALVSQGDSRRILPPCSVCHDAKGTGQKLDIPALAGQSEAYLLQTLKDYKSGERHNDLYGRMRSIVKEMTEEEIAHAARYYAGMAR